MKPDIDSRVDGFNTKLIEQLDDRNFQVNLDVDNKFDFILPDKDISQNLGFDYYSGVTPTYEEYDDMIVKGGPNDEDEVIDNYFKVNLIFDVGTNNKRCGTMVDCSQGLGGIEIVCLYTNPFFETREYEIDFTDGRWDNYTANIIAENMHAQVDDGVHQIQLLV